MRKTELEVISCWLHKMCSIDSRPCGSKTNHLAYSIVLKENASAVYLCQDGYTDGKLGAVWAWPPRSEQTVDQRSAATQVGLGFVCVLDVGFKGTGLYSLFSTQSLLFLL